MSNDPDLLDQPCPACEGDGGWFEDIKEDGYIGSLYVDCSTCGGAGEVSR